MKKILSFFEKMLRKRPSTDPEPDLQYSEDHTQHEEKKKCNQRSRNFQPNWKKTYLWMRFSEGKMYCGTCGTQTIVLSCLNRIMTDHRASLDVPTVNALMNIAINGPNHEEYDATRAVARWFTSGERRRRPEYLDRNRRDADAVHNNTHPWRPRGR